MAFQDNTLASFSEVLASNAPVPGGGGAAALVGAIGSALASMVANLTTGKKKYSEYEPDLKRILSDAKALREQLLMLIDEDAKCFEPLSRAYGIPKDDPARAEVMESALRQACTAPLSIMKAAAAAIELHAELEKKGSALMQSDVAVGVACCRAALQGASVSIYINLRLMQDTAYAAALGGEVEELLSTYCPLAEETYDKVLLKLK